MGFQKNIPSWMKEINFITSYLWQGCDVPFQLFCNFAKEPSGQAVALLIGLDMQDIAKTFFRPAGLRSHRHGRKGARGRKKVPDFPDVNEEIGKRIPGQQVIAGRPYGSLTRWAFEFSDVADRVAINIAILDIVSDTAYAGLLGIIEEGQSRCPWMRRGKSETGLQIHGGTQGRFQANPCPFPVYERGVQMLFSGAQLPIGGEFFATFDQTFRQDGPGTSITTVAMKNVDTGEHIDISDQFELAPGDTHSVSLAGTAYGGQTLAWEIKNTGEFVYSPHTTATVIQMAP